MEIGDLQCYCYDDDVEMAMNRDGSRSTVASVGDMLLLKLPIVTRCLVRGHYRQGT